MDKLIWVYDIRNNETRKMDILTSDHENPVPPQGYTIVGLRFRPATVVMTGSGEIAPDHNPDFEIADNDGENWT